VEALAMDDVPTSTRDHAIHPRRPVVVHPCRVCAHAVNQHAPVRFLKRKHPIAVSRQHGHGGAALNQPTRDLPNVRFDPAGERWIPRSGHKYTQTRRP
jgi:hypothetical protein